MAPDGDKRRPPPRVAKAAGKPAPPPRPPEAVEAPATPAAPAAAAAAAAGGAAPTDAAPIVRPPLAAFVEQLRLPPDFAARTPNNSDVVRALVALFHREVAKGGYLRGLMFAFVGFVEQVLAFAEVESLPDILAAFPPIVKTADGRPLDNLNVVTPKGAVSVRPLYNALEQVVLQSLRRYDFPRSAPYATAKWPRFRKEVVAIGSMSPGERLAFAQAVWNSILDLPEFKGRAGEPVSERPFEVVLAEFPAAIKTVPSGAILQGLVFAYYRADAPNVTLEVSNVRSGGARTGRVGDIDGWAGADLMLSIEVKDFKLDSMDPVSGFIANLREWPDATAIVLASEFAGDVRERLAEENILSLDRATMAANVKYWDLRKQQMAVREFAYYAERVERKSALVEAIVNFAADNNLVY